MAIDYKEIFAVFRDVIYARVGDKVDLNRILRARQVGAKPQGICITYDIRVVADRAGWLTNKKYDSEREVTIYETYKDIIFNITVRNTDPQDYEDDMEVYNIASSLHKAFTEESVLDYIYENLEATISTVGAVTSSSAIYPSGFTTLQLFDVQLAMVDVTEESTTPIEHASIEGQINNDSGTVTDADTEV